MRSVTVSAPGKLMLFGEHAVLHGSACIVTAVNQRMHATATVLDESVFEMIAPDVHITNYKKTLGDIGKGDIPKGAKFAEIAFKNFVDLAKRESVGIKITTNSDFSSQFGFGSSSAVVVCVLKALCNLLDVNLTNQELFHLAYKTVLDVQGKGSGFDIAAAIFGGTIYFKNGGALIEQLNMQLLPLVVAYSGVKADTVTVINQVEEKAKNNPDEVSHIYKSISTLVEEVKGVLVNKDWITLGNLMNENQMLLQQLGVSTKKLNSMIAVSKSAGAYGAKLSGAGGGDCMIALCSDDSKMEVQNAIKDVDGQVIDVSVNVEGVRVEV